MGAVANVGKCFSSQKEFLAYLESVKFGSWRPRFVTVHHTGAPSLAQWQGYQTRKPPISDEQWLRNLASYYGNELRWSSAPHFFFTPKHYCVLSPPERRGIHAVSFNALSWGVEMVGNFDREEMTDELRERYVTGVACLHVATGLKVSPYKYATQGIHFHRNDPKTSKTCPGTKINQVDFTARVGWAVDALTGGEAPPERSVEVSSSTKTGTVNVPAHDTLNVRADPSGKAPVVSSLTRGTLVTITGEALNGQTKWLKVQDGWVSARYVVVGG